MGDTHDAPVTVTARAPMTTPHRPPSHPTPMDPETRRERQSARAARLNEAHARRLELTGGRNPSTTPIDDPNAFAGRHLLADARYEDIARRLWMQQSVREIAEAHGMSDNRLRGILREPGMIAAYLRVKEELFTNLDKTLFDERAAPLLRARVQAIRAQTLLSEVVEEVRTRMSQGIASATTLKVGVDAAFGLIDRSGGEIALRRAPGATVNVNVNAPVFREGTEALIRGAIGEAGLDLSDITSPTRAPTIDVDAE